MAVSKKSKQKSSLSAWNRAIASVLSQTRRDADVSQAALARAMGWHRSKVVKIEAATVSIRAAEMILVAQALKIDPQKLLARVLRWNESAA